MTQLRLTRPRDGRPKMERLTERQREVVLWIRLRSAGGQEVLPHELLRPFGYRDPAAALRRLRKRGLIEKHNGAWRARRYSERTIKEKA